MVHHGPLIHWVISISPDGLVSKQAEQDRLHQREVQPGYGSTPWTPLVTQLIGFLTLTICSFFQWIGLREKLQENPIFNGKIYGFL